MTVILLMLSAWLGYDLLAGPRVVLEFARTIPPIVLAGVAALV